MTFEKLGKDLGELSKSPLVLLSISCALSLSSALTTNKNCPRPWYPWSVSKASSPTAITEQYLRSTVPPNISKPSSKFSPTSQNSTVVARPTPANVIPLISLSGAIEDPPFHTRT